MSKTIWNPSVIIAFVAVLISSATALISLKESKLMQKQQLIMQEQKEASVWPFIQAISYTEYNFEKDYVIYKYEVNNKGVGPAILNDVIYTYNDKVMRSGDLANAIQEFKPDFDVTPVQNMNIDNKVLAEGEAVSVVQVRFNKLNQQQEELVAFMHDLEFNASFCYCSVYGNCWKIEEGKVRKEATCEMRKEIR